MVLCFGIHPTFIRMSKFQFPEKRPSRSYIILTLLTVFFGLTAAVGTGVLLRYERTFSFSNYNIVLPAENGFTAGLTYGSWPALENAQFFKRVRSRLVTGKIDFIEANLSTMKLAVFKEGQPVLEVDILTKGKEGSWWETPAGVYKINAKEEVHFSSFGRVYMPWSLPFQGNFFIHGWPYFPDGQPVDSDYSGGCIRLSVEDAKKVFDLARVGMPVLVFEGDFENDDFEYRVKGPKISAKSYLAADLRNNFIFSEKASKDILPVASITKLVSALVATEYVNLEKEIIIDERMLASTTVPRLKPGEGISVFNLLYPLLLESSNEAANVLSYFLGPAHFTDLMNGKAQSIGMASSYFVDASGLDAGNVSTAEDLFNLAKYIYNNRSFIFKISTGQLNKTAYGSPLYGNLLNFNIFEKDPDFAGGKIGMTNASKETILAVFDLDIRGEERPVAIIVLGSENVAKDAKVLLAWLKANFQ